MTIVVVTLILVYVTISLADHSHNAFEEWRYISPLRIFSSLSILVAALYAPAYFLHRAMLRRFKWSIVEKFAFYPVISALMLSVIEVIAVMFRFSIPYREIFALLLIGLLVELLRKHLRVSYAHGEYHHIDINLKEALGIVAVIGFNLFILWSAIGGEDAFLRGDMWGEAHKVAFLIKYGLNEYLTLPVMGYPPLYHFFLSMLSESLFIPYINGLLITAFFNHLFSILALYALAKTLFRDSRSAIFTVILWTTLSGFSWSNLMLNPPSEVLSGNGLLDYLGLVSQRFGVHSGAIISPIYADDHALTRLWSLGLLFASMAALLKGYFNKDDSGGCLLVFSAGLIQILLSHLIEAPLLSLSLIVLILFGKTSSKFKTGACIATIVSSTIGAIVYVLIPVSNKIFVFISLIPSLAILVALMIRKLYGVLCKRTICKRVRPKTPKLKTIFFMLFLYAYGLMWIAFLGSSVSINWSIVTLWYHPAVEWGFLGLLSIFTLALLGLKKDELRFSLRFILFLFVFQLILLTALNYLNYYSSYIRPPYVLQPILFLPLLALITSQAFATTKLKAGFSGARNIKTFAIVVLIALVFSFGSLDHILSASFWKTNNGWWWFKPLNPSDNDYELINFLYGHSSKSPYEFVGTFYDWKDPSSYVVYPSGMPLLSEPLIDILSQTNDSREIYLLTHVFPINYVLVSKDHPPPPSGSLYFDGVDDYVEVPISSSLNMSVFTIEAWIRLSEYSQHVSPIVDRTTEGGGYGFWIGGESNVPGVLMLNGGFGNDVWSWGPKVELGKWTHVCVVWDGSNVTFFTNSVPNIRSGWTLKDIGALTTRIGHARWPYEGKQYFNGDIWQVRIYNRSLSQNEVLHLYKEPSCLINDGLVLCFRMDEGREAIVYDDSTEQNHGTIFGAQWRLNSYLAHAISTVNPIFSNDKYELYSLSEMNLSKTDLLPSSQDFLTAERITFIGNLTLVDELNGRIYLNNTNGEVNPIDEGKVLINTKLRSNETMNIMAMTPLINIKGNVTLIKMKSSWGYFSEIYCIAEKLTISGEASFKIFNTFGGRLFMDSIAYIGTYEAVPFPDFLRQDYAKEMIERYWQTNYVDPVKAIASPFGIVWTLIIAIILVIKQAPSKARAWNRRLLGLK
ncbi:MAG: LamG domain-containing protein [Candidatus Bathyarchaeia archaeon]|nr:LamG domain-containing protein [Candidatus Bathyarchaeia archaeon]